MISILATTEQKQQAQAILDSEYRLNELVTITDNASLTTDIVVNENIMAAPDWKNNLPPVLFPVLSNTTDSLKGIVYAKLGNTEKAKTFFNENAKMIAVLDLIDCLRTGQPIDADLLSIEDYVATHNMLQEKAVQVLFSICMKT
jgi:hypothetical protein